MRRLATEILFCVWFVVLGAAEVARPDAASVLIAALTEYDERFREAATVSVGSIAGPGELRAADMGLYFRAEGDQYGAVRQLLVAVVGEPDHEGVLSDGTTKQSRFGKIVLSFFEPSNHTSVLLIAPRSDRRVARPSDPLPTTIVSSEQEDFPRRAKAARVSGFAVVEFSVSGSGKLERVEVIDSSEPLFGDAAAAIVRRRALEPIQRFGLESSDSYRAVYQEMFRFAYLGPNACTSIESKKMRRKK